MRIDLEEFDDFSFLEDYTGIISFYIGNVSKINNGKRYILEFIVEKGTTVAKRSARYAEDGSLMDCYYHS